MSFLNEVGENIVKLGRRFQKGFDSFVESIQNDKEEEKALKCSSCGASLKADSSAEFIVCEYCGTQIKNPNSKFKF